LAAPNGLDREDPEAGLGEDSGEGTVELLLLEDFGKSSSLRRAGVGGVDSPSCE
jgi:hypothetical protein